MSQEQAYEDFLIIRLDGRDFHILAKNMQVERPFDLRFALSFVEAGKAVFEDAPRPLLAYLVSDEINFVFSEETVRGHLDAVSLIVATRFSNAFLAEIKHLSDKKVLDFDRQAFRTDRPGTLLYLGERQEWAHLNFLRAYAFWIKVASGLTSVQARKSLEDLDSFAILELIHNAGIDPGRLPLWQRRGIVIRVKRGSILSKEEPIDQSSIAVDLELALFKTRKGRIYLLNILGGGTSLNTLLNASG